MKKKNYSASSSLWSCLFVCLRVKIVYVKKFLVEAEGGGGGLMAGAAMVGRGARRSALI